MSCNRTTDNSGRHTMHYSLHSWYHKVSLPSSAWPASAGYLRHCQAHVLNLPNFLVVLHRRFHRATPRKDNQMTSCCTVASCCSIERHTELHVSKAIISWLYFPVSVVHHQPINLPNWAYANWPICTPR